MLKKLGCMLIIILLLFAPLFVMPSKGDTEEYPLEIRVTLSTFPLLAFQSVTPINVDVQLTNIGNSTFSGTLTIKGNTEENRVYGPIDHPISNLTSGTTQGFSMLGVRTDDAGTYWFTVTIEKNQSLPYGNITLYQGSILKIQHYSEVSVTNSVFLHSFTEFLTILGIVVGVIVSISIAIYAKKKG